MNKAHEKLVAYIQAHPEKTYSSIALLPGDNYPNNHPHRATGRTALTRREENHAG